MMQTFLPYQNFIESAECLDRKRLSKQRVETWQILRTLLGYSEGWKNHPAVRMWKGYEIALCFYGFAVCDEWIFRGYKDRLREKFLSILYGESKEKRLQNFDGSLVFPPWLGDEAFHSSHRAALLAKDPDWYSQFGWTEEPKIDYVWPV